MKTPPQKYAKGVLEKLKNARLHFSPNDNARYPYRRKNYPNNEEHHHSAAHTDIHITVAIEQVIVAVMIER